MNRVYLESLIDKFNINLTGLVVYTEAASGPYLYTPILAALAGAKVYAEARNTRYSKAADVIADLANLAQSFVLEDRIEIFSNRSKHHLSNSDIVTNSGNVRPIDRDLIDTLRDTAVIPLMWETWEFRASDFDLERCKERGIVVLGTNERKPPCDMEYFIGLTALKLLFESGFDGGKVLIMGNSPLPGLTVVSCLKKNGIQLTWVAEDPNADLNYSDLKDYWLNHGNEYDLIFLVDHHYNKMIIGAEGLLSYEDIIRINDTVKLSVMCGNIDIEGLYRSGLHHYPSKIAPFGFITYQPYLLGPRPVLTLYAAGLKVGEELVRARLKGLSAKEAVEVALLNSPAMDFEGDLSWL